MARRSESLSGLAVWPGLFLLAGGLAKAREARDDAVDGRTLLFRALPAAVPPRPAWAAVAGAELAVGSLVLAGVARPYPQLAAGVGLTGAALLAAWGVRAVPDAGCGCFGAQSEPVTTRTVVRAGALAALALAGAAGGERWTAALAGGKGGAERSALSGTQRRALSGAQRRLLGGAQRRALGGTGPRGAAPRGARSWVPALVMLGAGAALAVGSPDLRPQHVRARAHDVVCAHRPAPARSTLERLLGSPLWADSRPYLSADAPLEQWRDGCWRYLAYPATYEGEAATAVFALYLGKSRNADGVAFVADDEQRVLGQIKGRK